MAIVPLGVRGRRILAAALLAVVLVVVAWRHAGARGAQRLQVAPIAPARASPAKSSVRLIVVDVVDHFVSPTMRSRLIMLGLVVTLAFLCVLGYAMINPALDTVRYPERRQDSGVRTSVFWIPVLIGHALCIAVTATDLYRRFSPSHAGEQL